MWVKNLYTVPVLNTKHYFFKQKVTCDAFLYHKIVTNKAGFEKKSNNLINVKKFVHAVVGR